MQCSKKEIIACHGELPPEESKNTGNYTRSSPFPIRSQQEHRSLIRHSRGVAYTVSPLF